MIWYSRPDAQCKYFLWSTLPDQAGYDELHRFITVKLQRHPRLIKCRGTPGEVYPIRTDRFLAELKELGIKLRPYPVYLRLTKAKTEGAKDYRDRQRMELTEEQVGRG